MLVDKTEAMKILRKRPAVDTAGQHNDTKPLLRYMEQVLRRNHSV